MFWICPWHVWHVTPALMWRVCGKCTYSGSLWTRTHGIGLAFGPIPAKTVGAGMGPNAKPIPWVRVHKLPEYVHFPHTRHINAGVTCQTCHGQIQKMDRVFQYSSLNMGWCVSCHVNGYSVKEGIEAAGYAEQQPTPGNAANADRKKARYDCASCHY